MSVKRQSSDSESLEIDIANRPLPGTYPHYTKPDWVESSASFLESLKCLAASNLKLLRLRCCYRWLLRNRGHISGPKLEQDLTAAIRFQGLLERFLELVERVHMPHCSGERSISYEVSQLLVNRRERCRLDVLGPSFV